MERTRRIRVDRTPIRMTYRSAVPVTAGTAALDAGFPSVHARMSSSRSGVRFPARRTNKSSSPARLKGEPGKVTGIVDEILLGSFPESGTNIFGFSRQFRDSPLVSLPNVCVVNWYQPRSLQVQQFRALGPTDAMRPEATVELPHTLIEQITWLPFLHPCARRYFVE